MFRVSIGIPIYNEEGNIGNLLKRLINQKLKTVKIEEIIVLASGCTDQTVKIVKDYQNQDQRIKLIEKKKREGKTEAVNQLIKLVKEETLILISADVLPETDCLEKLILPFKNPKIGMTSGQVIPLNNKETLTGYFSHLWWQLFNLISQKNFRAGEVMAMRNLKKTIPKEIGSDDSYLTMEILKLDYQVKQVRSAIINNLGPSNLADLISIRRRHNYLTIQFLKFFRNQYFPKTMDNLLVIKLFFRIVNWQKPKEALFAFLCVFLEIFSRILAYYDFYIRRADYSVWQQVKSTKKSLFKED